MNTPLFKTIKSYVIMTIGLFIFVFSWTAFLIPNQIAGGGVSGLASVINYATGFEVAYSYLIINSILLLIGFLVLGKAFGFKTIFCIGMATLMFEFLPLIPWVSDIEDKLINALIGGTMSGIGIGMIFMQGGSTGGTDIIALIIAKYRETSPGRVFLYCDLIIIGSIYFIPDKELSDVIYGYIEMVSFSYVIDMILTGNRQSVQVMVFSGKYDQIADRVNQEVQRGVTALTSMGWYSKAESKVLVIVLRKSQLPEITAIIKDTDRNAFMTVSTVTSVYGQGFDQIKAGKISWKRKQKES
ncbi:MAG: YitT family protein [Bacteroidia bacterium]|nr:YitT family protein [Rikenellaceae bacterium]NCB17998.1 YitT family protein [Bacteroidia bacterium]